MNLSTTYLGMELPHPFMPGASPMVDDLGLVRRLEDAGAAAIVMHSLFEEQIHGEQVATHLHMERPAESFAEALSYLPSPDDFTLGPEEYLEQLRKVKEAVDVPVIGSLNGNTSGGWLRYARLMAEAGADALELNLYRVPTSFHDNAQSIEERTVSMVESIVRDVSVPVAVKLSPFYTSLPQLAARLDRAGVKALVIFNRFFQPDIDVEELDVVRKLRLSDSTELAMRLTWLAVLSGHVRASLAVTGGVHTAIDAIKAVMAGAHAVQMVSALLQRGPEHLGVVRREMAEWLEEHEYESLHQMQGSMNLQRCPDPTAFERANYVRILQSWRGFEGAKGSGA